MREIMKRINYIYSRVRSNWSTTQLNSLVLALPTWAITIVS